MCILKSLYLKKASNNFNQTIFWIFCEIKTKFSLAAQRFAALTWTLLITWFIRKNSNFLDPATCHVLFDSYIRQEKWEGKKESKHNKKMTFKIKLILLKNRNTFQKTDVFRTVLVLPKAEKLPTGGRVNISTDLHLQIPLFSPLFHHNHFVWVRKTRSSSPKALRFRPGHYCLARKWPFAAALHTSFNHFCNGQPS